MLIFLSHSLRKKRTYFGIIETGGMPAGVTPLMNGNLLSTLWRCGKADDDEDDVSNNGHKNRSARFEFDDEDDDNSVKRASSRGSHASLRTVGWGGAN